MSHPNLGMYRHNANLMRKKYKITPLDFDIILYASETDMVSQYELLKHVTNSKGSVRSSLLYLEKAGMMKVIRKSRTGIRGRPGGYTITVRARHMVTEFYMNMFPDAV